MALRFIFTFSCGSFFAISDICHAILPTPNQHVIQQKVVICMYICMTLFRKTLFMKNNVLSIYLLPFRSVKSRTRKFIMYVYHEVNVLRMCTPDTEVHYVTYICNVRMYILTYIQFYVVFISSIWFFLPMFSSVFHFPIDLSTIS